jgi:alpha-tubulin suppressor-like RCC1 family protein
MRWVLIRRSRAAVAAALLIASCLTTVFFSASPASALTTATQIAPGGRTSCAILTGGNAYCWGDNTYGQIGDGTTTARTSPTLVLGGYTWASLSSENDTYHGNATTCGVTTTGVGYCWGYNTFGQVGDGTTEQRLSVCHRPWCPGAIRGRP